MNIGELIDHLKYVSQGSTRNHLDRRVLLSDGGGGTQAFDQRMVITARNADCPASPRVCFIGDLGDMPDCLVQVSGPDEGGYYDRVISRLIDRLTCEGMHGDTITALAAEWGEAQVPGAPASSKPDVRKRVAKLVSEIDADIDQFFKDTFNEPIYRATKVETASLNAKHSIRTMMMTFIPGLQYQDMPQVANKVNYLKCKRRGPEDED